MWIEKPISFFMVPYISLSVKNDWVSMFLRVHKIKSSFVGERVWAEPHDVGEH